MALAHYQGYVENVSTGKALPGAVIRVYSYPGNVLQSTFADLSSTPLSTVVTDSTGAFEFYIPDGAYDLEYVFNGDVLTRLRNTPIYNPANVASTATLAASGGSALVGFLQAGTGAVARTIQSKERDVISVKDFGAVGNGVANDAAAIQAAIDAAFAAGGGTVHVPAGTYICGSTVVNIKSNVTLRGDGYNSSILQWSGTGDGLRFNGNINHSGGQALAYTLVSDLQLNCTNGSNVAGGGYVDIAGTFLALHRVKVNGFGYSVILDQSELADVDQCILQSANTGLLWLTNGPDHSAGAVAFFTNRISITRNQFDQGVTVKPCIIDDGGYTHTFRDNNFNGGTYHLRAAGVSGLVIEGNEWEGNSGNACIQFRTTTAKLAGGVGACSGATIGGNLIVPIAGQSCIDITSVNGLHVSANFLQTSSSIVKISGAQNASGLVVGANALNGSGPIIDNSAFEGSLTCANGANNNMALPYTGQIAGTPQFISITGPTAVFDVTGFVARYPGDQIIVYNASAFTGTIKQDSISSTAANRFFTKTGVDFSMASGVTVSFVYRANSARWIQVY